MSQIVVDASAAVQIALAGLKPAGFDRYTCVAPPLMWSEALSVLVEAALRGDIPGTSVDAALEHLEALPVRVATVDRDHRRRALAIARSLGWAKSYDAEYIALAQALNCPLLTIDARLARGASHLIDLIRPAELV